MSYSASVSVTIPHQGVKQKKAHNYAKYTQCNVLRLRDTNGQRAHSQGVFL